MRRASQQTIALFLGDDLSVHNQARAGIIRYARPTRSWRFDHLSRRLADLGKLHKGAWDGGIANFTDAQKITLAKRLGIPMVNIYGGRVSWGVPQVGVDNQAIGRVAARYFIGKGFRNLAFYGISGSGYSIGRWTGFRNAALAEGIRPSRLVIRNLSEREKGIPQAGKLGQWLARLPKPAGLLACDALMGHRVTEICHNLGITIPNDVAIVCVSGDASMCETSFPPLSCVPLAEEKCGYLAAEMLDTLLQGRPVPQRRLLAPGPVIERMSSDIQHVQDPAVAKALAYIKAHATRGMHVDELRPHTGVCRRVLERKFRRLLGRSPHEEIRNLQIEAAKRQLVGTNATLESIAQAIGLSSGIHLSHEFKKRTGQTPGQYRKQFRLL